MALYSSKDLTREKYAVSLSFSGQPFRLRLRKGLSSIVCK